MKQVRRSLLIAIPVVLVAALCISLFGGVALALTSLPHIEKIISDKGTYSVLEIVP